MGGELSPLFQGLRLRLPRHRTDRLPLLPHIPGLAFPGPAGRNSRSLVKRRLPSPPTTTLNPISTQACAIKLGPFRATPRQNSLAIPRRLSIICAASARGRHTALTHFFSPAVSTAQATQSIS